VPLGLNVGMIGASYDSTPYARGIPDYPAAARVASARLGFYYFKIRDTLFVVRPVPSAPIPIPPTRVPRVSFGGAGRGGGLNNKNEKSHPPGRSTGARTRTRRTRRMRDVT